MFGSTGFALKNFPSAMEYWSSGVLEKDEEF